MDGIEFAYIVKKLFVNFGKTFSIIKKICQNLSSFFQNFVKLG